MGKRNLISPEFIIFAVITLVCGLILFPLSYVFIGSLTIEEWGKPVIYSFKNYISIFTTPRITKALINTLWVGLGTTLLASFFGISLSWITARTNSPHKETIEPFNLIPFYLSPFVGAISWSYLASPRNGLLNILFMRVFDLPKGPMNIYSLWGIIWVMSLFYAPYMYLCTIGPLKKMDPSLEESARIAGSNMFQMTFKITLPLIMPSIIFGMSLTFITSIGIFGVPLALGVPFNIEVLTTQIYEVVEKYPGDFNLGSALCVFPIMITILAVMLQKKYILPKEFTTVTGKGYRPVVINLGKWKYLTFSFNIFYFLVAIVLPFLALLLVSLNRVWLGKFTVSMFTLKNYAFVLLDLPFTVRSIINSLILSTLGATLGVILGFITADIIHRSRARGSGFLDFVVSLPVSIPGMVLALGFLMAYIKTPLYRTLWIMLLSYVTHYITFATRNVASTLITLNPELEESARICGASWLKTIRQITFPIMKPGLIATWLMLFIIFIRELSTSILLYSHGNEVMSVALYELSITKSPPVISAFAMIQTTISFALVFVILKISRRELII